ncbi:MAG: winged helix-turn-helix domain-containing protein [Nanoarchaeota archaeon]
MAQKRTKLEVIKDILSVLHQHRQLRITRLIYKANLSNNTIKKYIRELLEKGLVKSENVDEKKVYKLTPKGLDFLADFQKMKLFSEAYGLTDVV